MRSKYILFALALTGALASCSDDDNKGTANYKNPYSNPLTDYSAADPTVWKENDHSFYVYATNTSVIRKSEDLIHWTDGGTYVCYGIGCSSLGTGYRKGG